MREAAVVGVRHVDGRAAGLRRRARDAGVFRGAAAGREAGGESWARDFEVGAHAAEGVVVLLAVDGAWAAVGLAAAIAEVHLVVRAGIAVDASCDGLDRLGQSLHLYKLGGSHTAAYAGAASKARAVRANLELDIFWA